MSSRNTDYSSAYKLKPEFNKLTKKLERRSINWKSNREDEVQRRRGPTAHISPLQEISVISNNSQMSYKDKTPVKLNGRYTNRPIVDKHQGM